MRDAIDTTLPAGVAPGLWLNPRLQLLRPLDHQRAWEARCDGRVWAVRFVPADGALASPAARHAWRAWRGRYDVHVVPPVLDAGACGALGYVAQPAERAPSLARLLAARRPAVPLPVGGLRALLDAVVDFYERVEADGAPPAVGSLRAEGVLVRRLGGERPDFALPEFGLPGPAESPSAQRARVAAELRALARVALADVAAPERPAPGVPSDAWALTDPACAVGADGAAAFARAWRRAWHAGDDARTVPLRRPHAPRVAPDEDVTRARPARPAGSFGALDEVATVPCGTRAHAPLALAPTVPSSPLSALTAAWRAALRWVRRRLRGGASRPSVPPRAGRVSRLTGGG